MWLIGFVLGLIVGGVAVGGIGAAVGGVVGLLAGVWLERRGGVVAGAAAAVASDAERIKLLEAQVDWLHRETQALRGELATLRGETPVEPPAGGAVPAAVDMPAPMAAPVEEIAAAASTGGEQVAESAAEPSPAPAAAGRPIWLTRLLAGNPLAKIGVVLLFFGVASALKLVAEAGLLPPSLRLLLAAVGGVAMIVLGFFEARPAGGDEPARAPRRNFGLALQGGGCALLYLVVYFMLARYAMIGQLPAFALFAGLGVVCMLLAARQDGPALAVLGLAGAFVAPLMAGGRSDTPLPLFSYFALLNVFILAVDWFRAWRVLNIAGFVLTLAIGMAWAIDGYRPEHYAVTQGFLIVFLLMYSATPVATALLRAPGGAAWREGLLIFGTPLAGAALQTPLVRGFEYGLAWSAFVAALYYFGLWALMFRRGSEDVRILERCHLGIALALLTVTIPLAFDAQLTSAFWAAEGAAVLWFGVRQRRRLAQAAGLAMQLAAGVAFIDAWPQLDQAVPVFNDVAIGGGLLAAAGLLCGRLLRRADTADTPVLPAVVPALWALGWWFATGFAEIGHFAAYTRQAPFAILFSTLTVLGLEGLGGVWRWPLLRHAALLLLPALWLGAGLGIDRGGHPLAGLLLLASPLAALTHYWLLARHERAAANGELPVVFGRLARHLGVWWLAILVAAMELAWLGHRLAPGVSLWPLLAWGVTPAFGLALAELAVRRAVWPAAALPAAYRGVGAWPPALIIVFWSIAANLQHAGGGSGLPYLPLLNFFDLVQLGALAALYRSLDGGGMARFGRRLVGVLAFLWLTMLAARIAHHWGGVPFRPGLLVDSSLCQALVTLLWTLAAITMMILAARSASRPRWFAGFGLLAVVGAKLLLVDLANAGTLIWTASLLAVALLVLAASYFAPVPPKSEVGDLR